MARRGRSREAASAREVVPLMIARTAGQTVIIRTPPEEVAGLLVMYEDEWGTGDGATRDLAITLERGIEHEERVNPVDAGHIADLYEARGHQRYAHEIREAARMAW